MSRSTGFMHQWPSGGWPLLRERRGGLAQCDGLDHRGLVSIGPPGRYPIDVARSVVDPVDAGDPFPLAQASSTFLEPASSLNLATKAREGRKLVRSILKPVAKRCSMNDRSEFPADVAP